MQPRPPVTLILKLKKQPEQNSTVEDGRPVIRATDPYRYPEKGQNNGEHYRPDEQARAIRQLRSLRLSGDSGRRQFGFVSEQEADNGRPVALLDRTAMSSLDKLHVFDLVIH